MKTQTTKTARIIIITLLAVALCAACIYVTEVSAAEPSYYVCLSTENYSVRNANRMTKTEGGYILEDVTLSPATGFYVTDNAGTRYTAADNDDLHTDEAGSYSYDIFFSEDGTFAEGWADTKCRVSYRFHTPAEYEVTVSGAPVPVNYNPYFTAYDQYYVSQTHIEAGQTVAYGTENHTVEADGYYRILFTPGETRLGNDYLFNDKGEYGSGDGYDFHVYIEDAPRYFAAIVGGATAETETEIKGEPAYLLMRDEKITTAKRYKSVPLFVAVRDTVLKYRIYEETASGYRMIDDDNDEDTEISKLDIADVGWYTIEFTDGGSVFATAAAYEETDFEGYYAVGEFNNYGFNEQGGLSLNDKYLFRRVEDGDDDYNEDYDQYILYIDVSKAEAKDGFELYITDGKKKYKDGAEYIRLNAEGTYKFLFSDEHNYGRGRRYRFTLENGDVEEKEVIVSTAEEYNAFAAACNREADYSKNITLYIKNDIDFDGKTVTQIRTFGGKIEGGYHTLKNIRISSDNDRAGVIGLLTKNGSIERLNVRLVIEANKATYVGLVCENYGLIREVSVDGSINGNNYVGGIVGYNGCAAAGEDDKVTDSDDTYVRGTVRNCENKAAVRGKTNAGGIVGYNGGEVANSINGGRINGFSFTSSDTVLGTGGICGFSYGKITNCENNGDVGGNFGSGTGGVCGVCTGEIYFSTNRAKVNGNKYVGGIAGYYGVSGEENNGNDYSDIIDGIINGGGEETTEPDGRNHILMYNLNFGDITAESYVGGVVGNTQTSTLLIKACASDATVRATAGSYVGGVCGYAAAEIVSCLGLGNITAEGLNGGSYAGGVCGYGANINYCMSSATVEGGDYVGGICGSHAGILVGSYSNVLIIADRKATHVGGICGISSAYDPATDGFTGVKSNYFIGEDYGGINGETYGATYDNAASRITVDGLSSQGALSPELDVYFDSEYWQGGKDSVSYPVPRAFEEVETCDAFGDDSLFDSLFASHSEELAEIATDGARISYNVIFKEWDKNNGDLYDPDIQYDNFETVSTVRCFAGDEITPPAFVYAEEEEGRWVMHGDKADYFVSYTLPATVTENTVVYAEYDEVHSSLSCGKQAFIEGRFGSEATAELIRVGDYFKVEVTGDEINESVTLKFFVGDKAEKYKIKVITDGEETEVKSTVSGQYLTFEYTPGTLFYAESPTSGLPGWAIGIIFAFVGAGVAGLAWLIVRLVLKKKNNTDKNKKQSKE